MDVNSGHTKRVMYAVPACAFGTRSSFASCGDDAGIVAEPSADRLSDEAVGPDGGSVQKRRIDDSRRGAGRKDDILRWRR